MDLLKELETIKPKNRFALNIPLKDPSQLLNKDKKSIPQNENNSLIFSINNSSENSEQTKIKPLQILSPYKHSRNNLSSLQQNSKNISRDEFKTENKTQIVSVSHNNSNSKEGSAAPQMEKKMKLISNMKLVIPTPKIVRIKKETSADGSVSKKLCGMKENLLKFRHQPKSDLKVESTQMFTINTDKIEFSTIAVESSMVNTRRNVKETPISTDFTFRTNETSRFNTRVVTESSINAVPLPSVDKSNSHKIKLKRPPLNIVEMNFENAQKNDLTRNYINFKRLNQTMSKKNKLNHSINLENKRNIPLTLKSMDNSFAKEDLNVSTISNKNVDKTKTKLDIPKDDCRITRVFDMIKDTKIKIRTGGNSISKEKSKDRSPEKAEGVDRVIPNDRSGPGERIQINHIHLNINKPNIKFLNIDKTRVSSLGINERLKSLDTIDQGGELEKGVNFIFSRESLKKVKSPVLIKNHPQVKDFFESSKAENI